MRDFNIKIEPFGNVRLRSFHSVERESEHGIASFSGVLDGSINASYADIAMNQFDVKIVIIDELGAEKSLFYGVISDIKVAIENEFHILSATLKSGTCLMDTNPHIRTYQASSIKYSNIIDSFMKGYKNSILLLDAKLDKPIEQLIVQYQENDWEFAKRIASHLGTVIIPNSTLGGTKFSIGIPPAADEVIVNSSTYAVEKCMDEYSVKIANGVSGTIEQDAVYYIIKEREIYELGCCIILNGHKLYISKIERILDGAEIYHTYYLKPANGFKTYKSYNLKAVGASLDGTVLNVEKDAVRLTASSDENRSNAGSRWFAYATVYSSPDGSGWYCMPEPGDAVRLYIPDRDEANAYVISSTHLDSTSGDERANPDYKSIMNKDGKEVLLTPGTVILTNNKGMSVEIHDDTGVKITSDKDITIQSASTISIASATDTLNIIAPKAIAIQQGGSQMHLEEKVTVGGSQVRIE